MEKIEIKRNALKEKCDLCDKVIIGTSEGQIRSNLKIHKHYIHNKTIREEKINGK